MRSAILALLASLACCTGVSAARADTIVYDDLAAPLGEDISSAGEIVDDVRLLAGGPWTFTSATVAYHATNFTGGVKTLTLTLYAMDGPPTPGSFGFDTPGTALFSQTVSIAAATDGRADFADGSGLVELPDEVGVGLLFGGFFEGESHGVLLFDPPAVGDSFDDYWVLSQTGWALATFGGDPPANFGVRISAVPDPTTGTLLSVGLLGLSIRRRCWARLRRGAPRVRAPTSCPTARTRPRR